MIFSLFGSLKYKNSDLVYCRYSRGGGMLGGYTNVTLKKEKNGNTVLTVETKQYHYTREVTTTYDVSPDAFDELKKLIFEYDMYGASKAKMSPFQVLDGDTTSISFDFDKGDFRVSDTQALSKKQAEGMREIYRYLVSLKKGEGVTTVEPQQAIIRTEGYSLIYYIEQPFDGKFDEILSAPFKVYDYEGKGIVINVAAGVDCTEAEIITDGLPGTIVYDQASGKIIALYDDCMFTQPVFLVANMDSHSTNAYELLKRMEGEYSVELN